MTTGTKATITMLYLGLGPDLADKPLHEWLVLADDWNADLPKLDNNGEHVDLPQLRERVRLYGREKGNWDKNNIAERARPGMIFQFPIANDRQITLDPKYLGTWNCEKDVAAWQAQHEATRVAYTVQKRQLDDSKQRLDREQLKPIKAAYRRAVGAAKSALLAEVVRYITGPGE